MEDFLCSYWSLTASVPINFHCIRKEHFPFVLNRIKKAMQKSERCVDEQIIDRPFVFG